MDATRLRKLGPGLLGLRAQALAALPDDAARARAERLIGQARLLVADKAQRLLEYER